MKHSNSLIQTALLVDDSDTMRMLIRSYLLKIGCKTCVEALSANEAQDTLLKFLEYQSPLPDVIFLDYSMRGSMNGLELLQFVRSHPQLRELPVIFATSEGETTKIVEAIHAGANAYLTKPFQAVAIEKALQLVFANKSSLDSAA